MSHSNSRRAALRLVGGGALIGLSAPSILAQGTAKPVQVAGIDFATSTAVANAPVILNGAGTSNIMGSKATAVGLYLPTKTQQVDAALSMAGPKRLTVVPLRNLAARDLSNALLDRLRQNATPGEIEANVLQIAAMGGIFGTRKSLLKGEVLTLDYLPAAKSTEFRLNGEKIGEPIVGEKFYPLLMKVWLGPRIRATTRDALMGLGGEGD